MNGWRLGIESKPFNEAMRDAREARGWTRKELATRARVGQTAVGAYEKLAVWPTEAVAERIAIALETPADDLFPDEVGDAIRGHPARAHRTSVLWSDVLSLSDPSVRSLSSGGDLDQGLARAAIDDVLESLTAREREVLRMRFGFDGPASTLEEAGKHFGVSKGRMSQIEAKALRKLRDPSRAKRLKDFLRAP